QAQHALACAVGPEAQHGPPDEATGDMAERAGVEGAQVNDIDRHGRARCDAGTHGARCASALALRDASGYSPKAIQSAAEPAMSLEVHVFKTLSDNAGALIFDPVSRACV